MTIHNLNTTEVETSKKTVGYRKKRKEDWIRDATWTRDGRTEVNNFTESSYDKKHLSTEYSEKDKEVKHSCKRNK